MHDHQPLRLIVVGASLGGVQALENLAKALPAGLPAAVLVVLHVGAHHSVMPQLLSRHAELPVTHARHGETLRAGHIYVAPPDRHLLLHGHDIQLTRGPKEHHTRPAIDPLFRSAALTFGTRVVGVVLTGALDDGTAGLQAIKQCGGIAVVQEPSEAVEPSMPLSALAHVAVDHCVRLADMAPLLAGLVAAPLPPAEPTPNAELLREFDLALGRGDAMEHLRQLGKPTTFTCPDCNGTLWLLDGPAPERYRCHTGHGFSLRSLQATLSEAADEILWSATRALQEKRMLLEHLAAVHQAAGDDVNRLLTETAARRVDDQVSALRALLEIGVE